MALPARYAMFQSVFPSTSDVYSSPTPQATPLLAQESFDHSRVYEGTAGAISDDAASEKIRWERSWHAATSFLSSRLQASSTGKISVGCPKDVRAALEYLASPDSVGWRLRRGNVAEDLTWWFSQSLQEQFLHRHGPVLRKLSTKLTLEPRSWLELRRRLIEIKGILTGPFVDYILPVLAGRRGSSLELLENSYGALLSQLLLERIRNPLSDLLYAQGFEVLSSRNFPGLATETSMEGIERSFQAEEASYMQETLADLAKGGFPAECLERMLAKVFDMLLKSHVAETCSRRWESPSPIAGELQEWVVGPLADLAKGCLRAVRASSRNDRITHESIPASNLITWQQTTLRELGVLRLSELFDIVVDWDNGSRGGIEDLRHYVSNPQSRMHVVSHFNETLSYRLLHPGASTDQILEVYIKIMKAFAVLDQRFVILDRVSRHIRRYLRDRDDTIRIIVAGLLSDPNNPATSPDALGELAVELHQMDEMADNQEDIDWDWDDMSWAPNPADAEADYRSSKGLDVIGNLLSLFEAKDTVVKEFQNILGERLLSSESDFSREIRVLELLKTRFGEGALQGCEVMIKDIFDSTRTDLLIKKEQEIDQQTDSQPQFYSKILSRFFWPSLRDDEFRVPAQVQALQQRYSAGFAEHKMQRKLTWLLSLGQVTVELQLEDRTVNEVVTTWQASVIYAFQGSSSSEDEDEDEEEEGSKPSPELTAEQIASQLEMDEDLVTNALTFWVSKLVLYQPTPGTGAYRVLETRPTTTTTETHVTGIGTTGTTGGSGSTDQTQQDPSSQAAAAAAAAAAADIVAAAHSASAATAAAASAASAVRSEEELAEEKMEVLWQYVVGMLTNQGAMPLQQMVMMLNFVVPGGFTHSQDEFRHFLQRKVDGGELAMAGASFRMPKK